MGVGIDYGFAGNIITEIVAGDQIIHNFSICGGDGSRRNHDKILDLRHDRLAVKCAVFP
jgi:hypothetical protein